ncbi:MAG: hypothetical protein AAF772_04835 [Acidobacteriota bacterium]
MFALASSVSLRSARLAAPLLALLLASPAALDAQTLPAATVDPGIAPMALTADDAGVYRHRGIAGALEASPAGVTLALDGRNHSGAADVRIDFVKLIGAPLRLAAPGDGSITTFDMVELRLGASAAVQPGIGAMDLVDELRTIRVGVEGSHRRLNLWLRPASPDGADTVAFDLPDGHVDVAPDGRTGTLFVPTLDGAQTRALALEVMALAADGKRGSGRLIATPRDAGGTRLQLVADGDASADLLLSILHSRHRAPDATVDRGDGRIAAVYSARADVGSTARDLQIVDFDGETGAVVGVTQVDLDADVRVGGAAVDAAGRLLVAGSHATAEGTDRMLLAAVESDRVAISPYVDGVPGALGGVLVNEDQTLTVTGTVYEHMDFGRTEQASFTLAVPRDDAGTVDQVYVAQLKPDLAHAVYATSVSAALPHGFVPRPYRGADGRLMIGVDWEMLPLAGTVSHTYAIPVTSSDMVSCPLLDDGWGYGALCWKRAILSPAWTYTPGSVPASTVPALQVRLPDMSDPNNPVGPSDAGRLNNLEANLHGTIYVDPNGQPTNPAGSWVRDANWAFGAEELALAHALFQLRWNSPIFANFFLPTGSGGSTMRAVMVRDTTFEAIHAARLPHNVCNEDSDNDGTSDFGPEPWPNPPEHQVATACATNHGHKFTLTQVRYDDWRPGSPSYVPDQVVSGTSTSWWPFGGGPYVGDPPEGEEARPAVGAGVEHIVEMARRLRDRAQRPTTIDLIEVEQNRVVSTDTSFGGVTVLDTDR